MRVWKKRCAKRLMVTSLRRPLVAANWKMNGDMVGNIGLLESIAKCSLRCDAIDVLVCPTFVHIPQAASVLKDAPVHVGAQNVSAHAPGAHTGDVSADMLREAGCKYVIVGHSERRAAHGETDAEIAARFKAVHAGGMTPILCVGESREQRDAGDASAVVARQIGAVVSDAGPDTKRFVVAYEPVWAIGTGRVATPEQVGDMHGVIRSQLAGLCGDNLAQRTLIIYGGSVKSANAANLFASDEVDGGLIGGASLSVMAFEGICDAAQQAATADRHQ